MRYSRMGYVSSRITNHSARFAILCALSLNALQDPSRDRQKPTPQRAASVAMCPAKDATNDRRPVMADISE